MATGQGVGFEVAVNDPTINGRSTDVAAFGDFAEALMFVFIDSLHAMCSAPGSVILSGERDRRTC
jgi:hypothetical protein